MKRFFKFLVIAALTLATSVFAFASCGGDNGGESSSNSSVSEVVHEKPTAGAGETVYTFTVLYPDGNPCEGLTLVYCAVVDGVEVTCKNTTLTTDSNGTVYQVATSGEYHVHVKKCPTGYTDGYDVSDATSAPAHVTETNPTATITLTAAN